MDVAQPSLDHLRVFVMVAECGSFNAAAKRLGRALSVVSYAVTTLEAQLGLNLFDRLGSRRPQLTEAGQALLADARAVANEADALVARARGIRQGLETRLALAIDVMMPPAAVARVLREFQSAFPTEFLASGTWVPAVDILETADKTVVLKAELPEMKRASQRSGRSCWLLTVPEPKSCRPTSRSMMTCPEW